MGHHHAYKYVHNQDMYISECEFVSSQILHLDSQFCSIRLLENLYFYIVIENTKCSTVVV